MISAANGMLHPSRFHLSRSVSGRWRCRLFFQSCSSWDFGRQMRFAPGSQAYRKLINTGPSFSRQLLEQQVEVFQPGVFDDDFAVAVVVFNVDFEAQGALQAVLDFADVGVDGRLGFRILLCGLFGMQKALDVVLCLANRKRTSDDSLGYLLHIFGVFEAQQRTSVAEAELAGLDAG